MKTNMIYEETVRSTEERKEENNLYRIYKETMKNQT